MLTRKLFVYSDGGSRGNPGHAACAFVVYNKENEQIFSDGRYLDITTNNQAEYQGVLMALKYLENKFGNDLKTPLEIHIFLDSKLIVEQMNGNYKIKSEELKPIYWQIRELIMKLGSRITFEHIPREKNHVADKIVNITIDKYTK